MRFLQDNIDFLTSEDLLQTELRYVFPSGQEGLRTTFPELAAELSTTAAGDIPTQTRRELSLCWDGPDVTPAEAFRYDACVALDHTPPEGTGPVSHALGPGQFVVTIHRGGYEHIAQRYAQLMRWALERDLTLSTEPTLEQYQVGPSAAAPDAYRTQIAWRLAESA